MQTAEARLKILRDEPRAVNIQNSSVGHAKVISIFGPSFCAPFNQWWLNSESSAYE